MVNFPPAQDNCARQVPWEQRTLPGSCSARRLDRVLPVQSLTPLRVISPCTRPRASSINVSRGNFVVLVQWARIPIPISSDGRYVTASTNAEGRKAPPGGRQHACPNGVCSTFTRPARRALTFSRLVAVPGINILGPEDWIDSKNRSWLRTILAQSASDRALYAFDYTLPASETFSWQSLLDQGDDLLTCLLELAEVENVSYLNDEPQIKNEGMKYLAGAIPDYCHCGPQLGGTCCQRSGGPTPRTKPFS